MTLERLLKIANKQKILYVTPKIRNSHFRKKCFRATKKGYLEYLGTRYYKYTEEVYGVFNTNTDMGFGFYFRRTNKLLVDGDSFQQSTTAMNKRIKNNYGYDDDGLYEDEEEDQYIEEDDLNGLEEIEENDDYDPELDYLGDDWPEDEGDIL